MNQSQIAGIIRHLITIAGGAGAFGSEDGVTQIASALAAFAAVLWSVWVKRPPRADGVPVGLWLALMALAPMLSTGCSNTGSGGQPLVTPARVEAVSALGAYYGGKVAIADGHRAELEQALAGLRVMAANASADLVAVAAALEAAGVGGLASSEGLLGLGAVSTFADLWSQSGQVVLDDERARAAIRGIVRGLAQALAVPRGLRTGDPYGAALTEEAVATRL